LLCICFAANTSPPQVRGSKALRGNRKKHRHRHKGDSVSSASTADSAAGKFGDDTNLTKSRSKGNRSAEDILQRTKDESTEAPSDEPAVEVTFEIKKKYDVEKFNYFCVENEKRSVRRAKSNDSLMPQHKIVVRRPTDGTAARDKSQTLPKDMSKSQETLDDYASSGDVTASEDGRSESCGSSVLESEL